MKPCEVSVDITIQKWFAQEQLQAPLHYPDQGDGEYAADPTNGKSMSFRFQTLKLSFTFTCNPITQIMYFEIRLRTMRNTVLCEIWIDRLMRHDSMCSARWPGKLNLHIYLHITDLFLSYITST